MRKQPSNPPAVVPQVQSNIITQVREYQLITPLFGGGVKPGEADELTTIRATEVRGHLRFWWRACRGGQYSNLKEMKEAEDAIWGKAHKKEEKDVQQEQVVQKKEEKDDQQEQTVQLVVEVSNPGSLKKTFTIVKNKKGENIAKPVPGIPAYAAFPLQPTQDELKKAQPYVQDVRESVSFKVIISFAKDQKTDIEAALWAWETFGGIGARTRRGFGALYLSKIDSVNNTNLFTTNEIKIQIEKNLSIHVVNKFAVEGVTYISKTSPIHISSSFSTPILAWDKLIRTLSSFRQSGRSAGNVWPEANAIRSSKDSQHQSIQMRLNKFPKASLGLPIVYHFKDDKPKDQTLQGATEGAERLASPIILRPLLCKNNQAVGIALLLDGPRIPPKGVVLVEKDAQDKPVHVQTTLTREEAQKIPVLNGETDVLQAFMKYLERNIR